MDPWVPTTRRVPSLSSQAATAAIPHSKPRNMGISFPPPPPPAKSTKAPTKSTFELPGEAFQRKIKEQKEARLKRMEEEEQRRKEEKAKPPPPRGPTPASPTKLSEAAQKLAAQKIAAQRLAGMTAGSRLSFSGLPLNRVSMSGSPAGHRASISESSNPDQALEKRPTFKKAEARKSQVQLQSKKPGASIPRASSKDALDRESQAQAVLKARREAADRGRETVKMWAEMQKQKEDRAKAAAAAASKV